MAVNGPSRTNQFSGIAMQHLTIVSEYGDECVASCPFCSGSATLYFNDVKGVWVCFKCGEKGTSKSLVEMLDGTYTEPEIELAQISDQLRSLGSDVQHLVRPLSDSYLRRFRQPGRPHELWTVRGFDEATCDRWELGYDFLGDALTLPYRDPATGQAAGIIRRLVNPGNGPRYQFLPGFARNRSLYGSWLLSTDTVAGKRTANEKVVLAEGPTDAVRVDQSGKCSAVAQYGSSISAGQIRLLHRLDVRKLVLFYDYDRAGLTATEKGSRLAEEFEVDKVVWDREKYCWHTRVCGCSRNSKDDWLEHTANLVNCPSPRKCKCGRVHEPDPGSLDLKTISNMLNKAVQA